MPGVDSPADSVPKTAGASAGQVLAAWNEPVYVAPEVWREDDDRMAMEAAQKQKRCACSCAALLYTGHHGAAPACHGAVSFWACTNTLVNLLWQGWQAGQASTCHLKGGGIACRHLQTVTLPFLMHVCTEQQLAALLTADSRGVQAQQEGQA